MAEQNKEIQPHVARMVVEQHDLRHKITALTAFTKSDKFSEITFTQQTLLVAQLNAMQTYAQILFLRINNEEGVI